MRFAASPLLVAVALGFLGPAALDPDEEECELAEAAPVQAVPAEPPAVLPSKALPAALSLADRR